MSYKFNDAMIESKMDYLTRSIKVILSAFTFCECLQFKVQKALSNCREFIKAFSTNPINDENAKAVCITSFIILKIASHTN